MAGGERLLLEVAGLGEQAIDRLLPALDVDHAPGGVLGDLGEAVVDDPGDASVARLGGVERLGRLVEVVAQRLDRLVEGAHLLGLRLADDAHRPTGAGVDGVGRAAGDRGPQ